MDGSVARLEVPVVVIGGGPGGLAVAMELQHHGIGCAVVEPRTVVLEVRPQAKTTSARTMELLRRWGVADAIRSRAPIPVAWSSDVVFCTTAAGAEITRFTGVLGLDLAGGDLEAEAGQQVAQPVVEQVLRDALASADGVSVLLGRRASAVTQDEEGVTVLMQDERGLTSVVRARYTVGADGARSIVRAAAGVVYEGGDAGRPNLSVVFRSRRLGELITNRAVHRRVLHPDAPGVVGPFDLGQLWWAIATGRPPTTGTPTRSRSSGRWSGRTSTSRCSAPTRGRPGPCWSPLTGAGGSCWPGTRPTRTRPGAVTASTPGSGTRSTSAGSLRRIPLTHVGPDVADPAARYGAAVVLVRPDQHIAWAGAPPTLDEADAILEVVVRRGLVDAPDPRTFRRPPAGHPTTTAVRTPR